MVQVAIFPADVPPGTQHHFVRWPGRSEQPIGARGAPSRPGEFQLLRTSAHFRFDCAPSGVAGEARLHASHHWRALIV